MKQKNKKIGKVVRYLIGFIILFGGTIAMLYPVLAEWVFNHRQDSLVETYMDDAANVPDAQMVDELNRAIEYNKSLYSYNVKIETPFENPEMGKEMYDSLLNIQGNGIMGFIKIPCIKVELPIYHGIEEEVLQKGVGHLEGSSLPVGGETTHSVLTGHTGLNQAKLFTDLTQMQIGDQFYLYVLDQKLAYEVDNIEVVLPEEIHNLEISKGEDYCTLVTCTPYGVNSHRLFVRGHRVPYVEEAVQEAENTDYDRGQSQWLSKYKSAVGYGIIIIVAIVGVATLSDLLHKKKNKHSDTDQKGGD